MVGSVSGVLIMMRNLVGFVFIGLGLALSFTGMSSVADGAGAVVVCTDGGCATTPASVLCFPAWTPTWGTKCECRFIPGSTTAWYCHTDF